MATNGHPRSLYMTLSKQKTHALCPSSYSVPVVAFFQAPNNQCLEACTLIPQQNTEACCMRPDPSSPISSQGLINDNNWRTSVLNKNVIVRCYFSRHEICRRSPVRQHFVSLLTIKSYQLRVRAPESIPASSIEAVRCILMACRLVLLLHKGPVAAKPSQNATGAVRTVLRRAATVAQYQLRENTWQRRMYCNVASVSIISYGAESSNCGNMAFYAISRSSWSLRGGVAGVDSSVCPAFENMPLPKFRPAIPSRMAVKAVGPSAEALRRSED